MAERIQVKVSAAQLSASGEFSDDRTWRDVAKLAKLRVLQGTRTSVYGSACKCRWTADGKISQGSCLVFLHRYGVHINRSSTSDRDKRQARRFSLVSTTVGPCFKISSTGQMLSSVDYFNRYAGHLPFYLLLSLHHPTSTKSTRLDLYQLRIEAQKQMVS